MVVDGLFLWSAFNSALQPVQEHVEVLLNVHLFDHVDWLAFPVLEGVAVGFGADVHFLRKEQACKQTLPLKEHVVCILVFVVVRIRDGEDVIAEAGDHEQLLVQRVHIANAAKIFEADIASRTLFIDCEAEFPVTFLMRSPARVCIELSDVAEDVIKAFWNVSGQNGD